MKKKLFILIIVLVAFIGGICLNHFISQNSTNNTNIPKEPKERQFNSQSNVPVSNSSTLGSKIVFKSFFAYDNSLDLNEFMTSNEDLYFKKIISYDEYLKYKELIPELRTLTEDDFVNYYLVMVLSQDTNSIFMFNKLEESDDSLSLEISKNTRLSELKQTPIYSGVAIILPNVTEVPDKNIQFVIDQN